MRNIVYHVATSLDNFIAEIDGTTANFVSDEAYIADYLQAVQGYDTVLMGRATYEAGYQFGQQPGQPSPVYPGVHYIFSKTLRFDTPPHERVKLIDTDVTETVQQLKQAEGSDCLPLLPSSNRYDSHLSAGRNRRS